MARLPRYVAIVDTDNRAPQVRERVDMSAYVVDNETITRILDFIRHDVKHGVGGISREPIAKYVFEGWELDTVEDLEVFGNELLKMNRAAVMQRYPDSAPDNLPGPIDPKPLIYTNGRMPQSLVRTYKDVQCLGYQCAEGNVPEWELYKQLDKYETRLAGKYIRSSEEYEVAPWG